MLDESRRRQQVADRADEQQAFNNQLAVVTAMPEGPQRTQALSQLQAMMQPSSGEVDEGFNPSTPAGRQAIRARQAQQDEVADTINMTPGQGVAQVREMANPPSGISVQDQIEDFAGGPRGALKIAMQGEGGLTAQTDRTTVIDTIVDNRLVGDDYIYEMLMGQQNLPIEYRNSILERLAERGHLPSQQQLKPPVVVGPGAPMRMF